MNTNLDKENKINIFGALTVRKKMKMSPFDELGIGYFNTNMRSSRWAQDLPLNPPLK